VTTLISWVAFDQRKFAAAYVASDSRITWDEAGNKRWDAGRKVFPSSQFPDIFGYVGDVLFPALALSQIVEAIDAGVMFPLDATPWQRHEAVVRALQFPSSGGIGPLIGTFLSSIWLDQTRTVGQAFTHGVSSIALRHGTGSIGS
jgi:hypothetical protein